MAIIFDARTMLDVTTLIVLLVIAIMSFVTLKKSSEKFLYFAAGLLLLGVAIVVDITGIPGWSNSDAAFVHSLAQVLAVLCFFTGAILMKTGYGDGKPRGKK